MRLQSFAFSLYMVKYDDVMVLSAAFELTFALTIADLENEEGKRSRLMKRPSFTS